MNSTSLQRNTISFPIWLAQGNSTSFCSRLPWIQNRGVIFLHFFFFEPGMLLEDFNRSSHWLGNCAAVSADVTARTGSFWPYHIKFASHFRPLSVCRIVPQARKFSLFFLFCVLGLRSGPRSTTALNFKPSLAKSSGCSNNWKWWVNDNEQCLGLYM